MVSAADSLLKYLNYCLHEELLSLEELTSVGQALSESDVMSDASLLLEETYQLSDYFIQSSERLTSADRLTDLLGKVSYTFAEKVAFFSIFTRFPQSASIHLPQNRRKAVWPSFKLL